TGDEFNKSKIRVGLFQHYVNMNEWLGWLYSLTGATVIPMVLLRESGDKLKLIIEPPIQLDTKALSDRKKACEAMNLSVFRILESYLAKYPTQWFGWHNLHRLGLTPKDSDTVAIPETEHMRSTTQIFSLSEKTTTP
ncbi:MAG: hypothetical protein AB1489_38965, partial [Acidobacteriota bacterium]